MSIFLDKLQWPLNHWVGSQEERTAAICNALNFVCVCVCVCVWNKRMGYTAAFELKFVEFIGKSGNRRAERKYRV